MDRQGRNLYPHQHDPQYNHPYVPNHSVSRILTQSGTPSEGNITSCDMRGEARLSTSGMTHVHPHLGIQFDPLYTTMHRNLFPMQHIHPALMAHQSRLHQSGTGINQLNPVLLVSPNDNNNCNRSRAASHSSVFEHQHLGTPAHLHQHLHPVPAYHPYYGNTTQKPQTNYLNEGLASHLHSFRRNSTSAALPQQHELENHQMGVQNQDRVKIHPLGGHPMFSALPYSGAGAQNLPHVPAAYKNLYRYAGGAQEYYRRHRCSLGAILPSSDQVTEARRRNSIPTGLEIQHISDESSSVDDDDDDVFAESPAIGPPAAQSSTASKSYLEQLRESRKRALSAREPSTSSKYTCHEARDNMPPMLRFRRRIINDKGTEEPDVNGERQQDSTQERVQGSSSSNQRPPETEIISNSQTDSRRESSSVQAAQQQRMIPKILIEGPSRDGKSEARDPVNLQSSSVPRNMTPSPSILKKTRRRINRNFNEKAGKSEEKAGSSDIEPNPVRQKSLPLKKQVAWKDKPTYMDKSTNSDVIICPMKHDLLTESNLEKIRKNPPAFTTRGRIGPYLFGPKIGSSPVRSISQYLVRKEHTYNYYMAKVLSLGGTTIDDKSGRMLLYSEHSLLTLLKDHPGVIRHHGFHKDVAYNPKTNQVEERLCLILDCLCQHDFDESSSDFLNLQQHVIQVKRLSERETIKIFISIIEVVNSLHELNVVHRDLKLGNMVLHRKTQKVILTNFCLGRHLMSDNEQLKDQRGSPAYISPDVLIGKPYAGKASDMWSLGVVLFMMLYGKFPFYDQEPPELFRKIKKADFVIPSDIHTSSNINDIIRGLLTLDPTQRLTASDTLLALHQCANTWNVIRFSPLEAQVVPDVDNERDSSSEDEDDKNDEIEQQRYMDEELTRVFQEKLLSDDEKSDSANQDKGFGRTTYQASNPTVQHLTYDARPLTQDEIAMHRRLLVNSTLGVRVHSAT